MEEAKDFLVIGKVLKPFGIKGEVKVGPITERVERFNGLPFAYVKRGEAFEKVGFERTRISNGYVYAKIAGCVNRNDVEALAGEYLYIDRVNAVPIDPSSHYYIDVVGCRVKTLEGELLGTVINIQNAGSCDVYFVRAEGSETKEFLIPAISDVVRKIDTVRKEILIAVVDGLL